MTPERDRWWERAACAGQAPLFDARSHNETDAEWNRRYAVCLTICQTCPVRGQCAADRADQIRAGGINVVAAVYAGIPPAGHRIALGASERDQTITRMAGEGATDTDIGRALGCSRDEACRLRRKLGVESRNQGRRPDVLNNPATHALVVEYAAAGLSDRQIARRINTTIGTVFRHRQKHGIPSTWRSSRHHDDQARTA